MLADFYMHDMGWGWGVLMTLGWLALLGLFVGVLIAAIRDRRSPSPRESLDADSPRARSTSTPTDAPATP